jgi:hypothetical protein
MKKIIKKYVFAYVCLIFLTTKTSVSDVKRIVYPSFVNSVAAGAIVGSLAPTARSSFFLLTFLTSPIYNTIPLALGLINVIITLKKERNRTFAFQTYYASMQTMSFNNLIDIIGIANACFLVTIFTYYTCFDIANSLKQSFIKIYKNFIS